VDYTFKNNVILGVAVSGERTRVSNSYNGGTLSGSGNTIAPYLAWAINRSWVLDASIGYGRTTLNETDNSVAGGITGSTRDKRSLGSLGLSYNRMMGKWQLTGKGVLLTAEDRFDSYTLSNGTVVPGKSTRTTQARVGGQAAYNAGNGFVPWAGLTYIYDIDRSNQGQVGGQSAANDRDGVLVQMGINFQSKGAFYGGITLSTEQSRRQVKNDQVLLNVGLRF
jgi:outer membrane autotransporter protein